MIQTKSLALLGNRKEHSKYNNAAVVTATKNNVKWEMVQKRMTKRRVAQKDFCMEMLQSKIIQFGKEITKGNMAGMQLEGLKRVEMATLVTLSQQKLA